MDDRSVPHGLLLSPEDSPLLTCAELHVYKIVEDNGEAPRQEWVGQAPPLQVLGTKGDIKNSRRPGPNSLLPRALTVPTPKFHLQRQKGAEDEFLSQYSPPPRGSVPIPPSLTVREPRPASIPPQLWAARLPHLVSRIFGVHSYGHVSQHCFDPSGCHHHLLVTVWGDMRPCGLSSGPFSTEPRTLVPPAPT